MSGIEMEEMDFGMGQSVPIGETTLAELNSFCEKYKTLYDKAKEVKEELEALEESKKEYGTKIVNLLNEFKMPSIKNEFGNFIISNRFTVTTPKTPETKQAFFAYLQEKGIFEDMVSVNSQTLNAYYRTEMDQALERGEVDFSIPGIGEASMVQTLSLRKK